MAYIPPPGNEADFEIVIYIAPAGNEANFDFSGATVDERNSEIRGIGTENSDRNSEITGTATPSERDSEVTGAELISSEINSEILGKRFIPIARTYRILVKDQDGVLLGEFEKFRNLKIGKRLNNYGTASFEIPVTDPKADSLVSLRKYTIEVYYEVDAGSTLVWAGEQALREGSLDNAGDNWCTIYCFDWLEQLNSRFTRVTRVFSQVDAGEIAWTLIDETQLQLRDYALGLGPSFPLDGVDSLETSFDDQQTWGFLASVPFYQSFIAPMTGKLNKVFILTDEDDSPVIGDRVVSIYTDTGSDAPNAQISGSQVSMTINDDGLANMFWIEVDYSELDVQVTEGTKYWLRVGWTAGTGNNGSPTWRFKDSFITGRVEIPGDPDAEAELVGYDFCCRFEFIGSTADDADNGSFGITQGTIETTIDRDRAYFNQNIMEAIINLSNVLSGFDFEITNEKVFNVYVVKGEDKTEEVVLEYGVNIESVKVVEDFVKPTNRAIVLGQSTDDLNQLVRIERDDTALQDIYKVREGLMSEMDVSETNTMNEKGDAMIRKYGTSLFKIDINMASVLSPNITEFSLGDSITLIIKSGIYNIREQFRVFEWEVTFNDNNVEKLTLILGNFTYE